MTDFFDRLAEALTSLGTWGYVLIVLVVFCETLIAVGQFLPGSVFLAFVGFLCYLQVFELGTTAFLVFLAHYLGEFTNYFIGLKKGRAFFKPDAMVFRQSLLEAVEKQLKRWGALYFVLCQFSGVLRPVLSFLAGAARYSLIRFAVWMIPACAGWTIVHLGAGFVLGASWHEATKYVEEFSLLIAIVVICVAIAIWLSRTLVALAGATGQAVERAGRRVLTSSIYQRCRQLNPTVFHFVERRLSLSSPWGWQATVRFIGAFVLCGTGLFLGVLATHSQRLMYFDSALVNLLAQLRRSHSANVLAVITSLGEPRNVIMASVILFGLGLVFGMRRSAALLIGAPALALGIGWLGKWFFERGRPDHVAYIVADGNSFPSNHCTVATAFLIATCIWLWQQTENLKIRVLWASLAITMILLIAYSRLYLGVHYLTDILGGCLIGLGSTLAVATVTSRIPLPEEKHPATAVVLASLSVLGIASWNWKNPVEVVISRDELFQPRCSKNYELLEQALELLPRFATRLTGTPSLALDMVVVGDAKALVRELEERSWRRVCPQAFYTREIQAPIFPAFVDACPALFTLEKRNADNRMILRLWTTDVCVGSRPLWVGSLIEESLHKKFLSMEIFAVNPDIDKAIQDWCERESPWACQIRQGFRKRGLYYTSHPFFTHGILAVLDLQKSEEFTSQTVSRSAE